MPQLTTKTISPPRSKTVRIAIIGAGFSGAILARQLLRYDSDIEVTVFEKMQHGEVKQHWTQPVTGAGLNINANAMATLKQIDTELYEKICLIGLPRQSVTAVTVTGKQLYQMDVVKAGLADTYGCRSTLG